ncbi:FKBP-type peptidylprolyl isomerase [Flavobacterium sp. HXWNR69]|uniref:FKBP-type peptidylprolyl isomerase n=1 Tax=Flavobacterium fragile TaxID=2949085 RepID=A0ABT0TJL1_9FLAO|nr:FKBP-type peptidylprolyl isomerase [Flavobacterium sp. HXWNR69]MCL9771133.1 FKBP-type peptidylprolyl isomerase [Flavobacterium sp. HXWNR69]
MNSFFKIVLVAALFTSLYSCQKDDGVTLTPDRPYGEVFVEDSTKIREFMDSHYITYDSDFNVTFTQIPNGGSQTPISDMNELDTIQRKIHDITYVIYYLKLREGSGENITRVDSSFVSYKGFTFNKTTTDNVVTYNQTVFDEKQFPVWFSLDEVIRGWSEIIPLFKTGTYTSQADGTISFDNFGAGVMFVPSGLAYFSTGTLSIPSYTPTIFTFKLHNLRRRDHDRDKVLSMYEYGNPLDTDRFKKSPIDTDGDGRPDYIDVDDDGDGVLTKTEIAFTYDQGGVTKTGYYPYHGALVDDPSTPYNDTFGIPRKYTGPLNSNNKPTPLPVDFTDVGRIRRHLDNTSKPPYE